MRTRFGLAISVFLIFATQTSWAQKGPSLPGAGMTGSAGVGFADFTILSPKGDFKLDRGTYVTGAIERPFGVLNLHLVLSIAQMTANGKANYDYLSDNINYLANDLSFKARMFDLGLGLKFKLFESFWFRPYVGGGGLGGYHELSYSSSTVLTALGSTHKSKDTIMGSGYYGEGGLEIEFTSRFGVQLAARLSDYTSKPVETIGNKKLHFRSETYYFAALIGF